MKPFICLCVVAVGLTACSHRSDSPPSSAGVARVSKGPKRLGDHRLEITTNSREAQRAFNRGLTWAYSFGHHAAEQEFRQAAEADPECAMAYWGIALVNGPHINFPMVPPVRAKTAWEALSKARALAPRTTELEQALIEALGHRYANPQPEDRSGLDKAYAEAMGRVWARFPRHDDVGALYAEAEMDLHPWDLWTAEGPQLWTPRIVATLERVLELNSRHPGANHYYIHAMEASADPGKAVRAAERLTKLVPDSSHMVHMPAHIFARVGRWADAANANVDAMKADSLYRAAYPRPGFYGLYMAHNAHFLAFTSMMRGRSEEAIRIARQMVEGVPPDFLEEYPGAADGFLAFVPEVLMRFGKWEEILAEPAPPEKMLLARALWHFTRTSAFTTLNRIEEAQAERAAFLRAAERVPEDATFGNNKSRDLIAIAGLVIEGEMAAQREDFETAIARLENAVAQEDELRYDEPPDWIQPVRHTLGAVLLRKGDPGRAEVVYRQDLEKWRENGWGLMGLRDSLQQQGKEAEAMRAQVRHEKAWAGADIRPTMTCYCQETSTQQARKDATGAGNP